MYFFFVICFFCTLVIKIFELMVLTLTRVIGKDSWYRHGRMELTRTHGIDMDSL